MHISVNGHWPGVMLWNRASGHGAASESVVARSPFASSKHAKTSHIFAIGQHGVFFRLAGPMDLVPLRSPPPTITPFPGSLLALSTINSPQLAPVSCTDQTLLILIGGSDARANISRPSAGTTSTPNSRIPCFVWEAYRKANPCVQCFLGRSREEPPRRLYRLSCVCSWPGVRVCAMSCRRVTAQPPRARLVPVYLAPLSAAPASPAGPDASHRLARSARRGAPG